jgi:hypothetical protein
MCMGNVQYIGHGHGEDYFDDRNISCFGDHFISAYGLQLRPYLNAAELIVSC